VIALVRYTAVGTFRTQRWIPPTLLYLVVVITVSVTGGSVLPGFATTATALFPVAAWLARVAITADDPVLREITAINAGSHARVRLGATLTAAAGSGALGLLAVIFTLASNHVAATGGTVAAGIAAHALVVISGTAVGSITSPPLIPQPGLALITVLLVTLTELTVPFSPPIRGLLQIFNASHLHLLTGLSAVAGMTIPPALALITVSAWVAGRRS